MIGARGEEFASGEEMGKDGGGLLRVEIRGGFGEEFADTLGAGHALPGGVDVVEDVLGSGLAADGDEVVERGALAFGGTHGLALWALRLMPAISLKL